MQKYEAAISDTDILINLAKIQRLDVLELLFSKIYIPKYIYDKELKKKAKGFFCVIDKELEKENTIFEVVDRTSDRTFNCLAKQVIDDMTGLVGPGEVECAGYATALKIPIIISDNYTEFKWFVDTYIMLTHNNLLSLCVKLERMSLIDAEEIYKKINDILEYPSSLTFDRVYKKSLEIFNKHGWDEYLY